MRFVIIFVFAVLTENESSVLFRIRSINKNVSIKSSYLLGTAHVAQSLIWPHLSNETLRIITESNQIWMELDVTDSRISKEILKCAVERLSTKQQARLRAMTWSRFLNETKRKFVGKLIKPKVLIEWRQWFTKNKLKSSKFLWRNQTATNDTLFDLRIILDAYRRGAHVGSLESLPTDCFQGQKTNSSTTPSIITRNQNIAARLYNCDMINDDLIRVISVHLDMTNLKKRNQQITKQIRKLLKKDPHKKYLFAVGAAHLFGNISIVQMLKEKFHKEYYIEQINSPPINFSYELCTQEQVQRLLDEKNSVQEKTIHKRSVKDELFEPSLASFFD